MKRYLLRPVRVLLAQSTYWLAMLLAVACLGSAGDYGAVDFPATDAGKRARGYFEAFNGTDEGAVRAYIEENLAPDALQARPLEDRMATNRRVKSDLGTLTPVKVVAAGADALTVVASGATGKWVEVRFKFEEEAPHKVTSIGLRLMPEPPDLGAASTPLSEVEMIGELRRHLSDVVAKDEFSGVVLVARGSSPIFREAYGLASKEYGVRNRVDTRFNLGSINKFITRIAIEQLVGRGVLSLDDTIGKYLPDYPNKDAASKVTIRHLVDMTSGIGDFFGDEYMATPKDRIRNLEDYLPLFAGKPLLFEPGTDSKYSNGGYVVLGLIVAAASGQTYFDYVRDNVYAVAGMNSSGHLEADVPAENVASGYTRGALMSGLEESRQEQLRNNIYSRPARGSSAGGGYSTADDLLNLVAALNADKLSAPGVSKMVRDLGIAVAGGAPGINAFVETRGGGYVIVVLSNYDPPAAEKVARAVGGLLDRMKQEAE